MEITERIREKAKNKSSSKPILISFLGDSVTQGCFELYSTGKDDFQTVFRPEEAYCQKLKRLIETVLGKPAVVHVCQAVAEPLPWCHVGLAARV